MNPPAAEVLALPLCGVRLKRVPRDVMWLRWKIVELGEDET